MALLDKITWKSVAGLGLGIFLTALMLVLFIDVLNFANLRSKNPYLVPFVFDLLFREGSIIEIVQWGFLGAFILVSASLSGRLMEKDLPNNAWFWRLFAVTGVLMLIEDAGNVRHFIFEQLSFLDWFALNVVETFYFILIAAIPIFAVLKFREVIYEDSTTTKLLGAAFLFYGLAAALSGPSNLFGIKSWLGNAMYDLMILGGGTELDAAFQLAEEQLRDRYNGSGNYIGFRLVDHLLEESLELLGATFLLSSATAYHRQLIQRPD